MMFYSDEVRPEIQKVINSMSVENWDYVNEFCLKNRHKDVRLSFNRDFQCMNLIVEGKQVKLTNKEEELLNGMHWHTMEGFRRIASNEAIEKLKDWNLEED